MKKLALVKTYDEIMAEYGWCPNIDKIKEMNGEAFYFRKFDGCHIELISRSYMVLLFEKIIIKKWLSCETDPEYFV